MNENEGIAFIDNVEDLSAMPSLALDVMSMLNDTTSTVKGIVDKLKLDQAMVSYILKTCNSPLYGIRSEIASITRALNLLGFTNLKSILMSYFMRNLYRLSGKCEIKESLWKHAISVAVLCKNLAPIIKMNSEEAYLAGLLHDIGKIVLFMKDPITYQDIINRIQSSPEQMNFYSLEKQLLNYTHAEVGYFLLDKWQFSEVLKEAVLHHHDSHDLLTGDKMVGLVAFADQLSHVFLENKYDDLDPFLKFFHLSEPQLDKIVQESILAIEEYCSIL